MPNAVFFNSYKLKKDASVPDFLHTKEKLTTEYVSKQKGWVSSAYFVDGETWADYSIWETMDDLNTFIASSRAATASGANELAKKTYSFMNLNSGKSHRFSVERCYGFEKMHFDTSNIITFHSYKLKDGASVSDFTLAVEKASIEFVSQQKGWISSKLLLDGDTWADIAIFNTEDDLKAFVKLCNKNDLTSKWFSFIDFGKLRRHRFYVERSYK